MQLKAIVSLRVIENTCYNNTIKQDFLPSKQAFVSTTSASKNNFIKIFKTERRKFIACTDVSFFP